MELINKYAVLNEIDKLQESIKATAIDGRLGKEQAEAYRVFVKLIDFIENLGVVAYSCEQTIQYDSIKAGIQAHAETYSFNIESKLFNQLTKEQQELWREEIEQACISGGEAGVELARDPRYKENQPEVKEELSVEEKAKKYDEAIKIAKDCQYDSLALSQPVKDVIEYIFPELKEDERIKSCIKKCLSNADEQVFDNYHIRLGDCLAWIEKQDNQGKQDKKSQESTNEEYKFKVGD